MFPFIKTICIVGLSNMIESFLNDRGFLNEGLPYQEQVGVDFVWQATPFLIHNVMSP